jgi:hypothetical protein
MKEIAMLTRVACFVLVITLGLSACTRPISSSPEKDLSPTAIPDIGQGTDLTPEFPLPRVSPVFPTEITEETTVSLAQATPTASYTIESVNRSTADLPSYARQVGTPRLMANFIQPEAGCNWMGVGGQVFRVNGQPVTSLVVEVGGKLNGADIFHLVLTGNQSNLGAGGYLITLSDQPVASSGSLWIMLYDLGGQSLTDQIYFSTVQDCARNFVLINFAEVNPNGFPQVWLPIIGK